MPLGFWISAKMAYSIMLVSIFKVLIYVRNSSDFLCNMSMYDVCRFKLKTSMENMEPMN